MTARVLRPAITLTTVLGILLAALAVYTLLTAGAAHANSRYNPQFITKNCNDMETTFPPDTTFNGAGGTCNEFSQPAGEGLAAGGNPKITTILNETAGDLNFSGVVTLAPKSQIIAGGGTMPSGERIGALHSDTTLGTFNNACLFTIGVDFILYNTELPDNAATPRSSGNITYPQPEGTSDRFGRWGAPGAGPILAGGGDPVVLGSGGATNNAVGSNNAFQGYPSYLLDYFDPDFTPGGSDGAAQPLLPLAVYGGLTRVVTDIIPLFFVQFGTGGPAGTAVDLTGLANSPLKFIANGMGQPSVSVLNDPTAVQASVSDITDFCTPLGVTTILFGITPDTSKTRVTSPGAGTQQFNAQYNASLRDTDQDSYENALDSCPVNVNVGDPRSANSPGNGDSDSDGIDNSCDGVSNVGISDQDGDLFKNRLDNCPQVANATQLESELGAGIQADHGPRPDTMGDACDSGSATLVQNGLSVTIPLSTTISNGRYMTATNIVAKCVGGPDVDKDGYCDGGVNDSFTTGSHSTARHNAWGPTNPALLLDTDGDGVSDGRETWYSQCEAGGAPNTTATPAVTPSPPPLPFSTCVPAPLPSTQTGSSWPSTGSDTVHSCAVDTTINTEIMDNWGFDFNDDGKVNGSDLLTFASAFLKSVDQGTVTVSGMGTVAIHRWDLNADGAVNGSDFFLLSPFVGGGGKTCAQAGVPAFTQQ